MPQQLHGIQSGAAPADAAPPEEHTGTPPPGPGSHWVSARMSARAEPLLPAPIPDYVRPADDVPVAGDVTPSHSMSSGDDAPPSAGPPPLESADLTARIEALRAMLDQARDESTVSPDAPASTPDQGSAEHPMPKFLRDEPFEGPGAGNAPSQHAVLQPAPVPPGAPWPARAQQPPSALSPRREPKRRRSRAPWIIALAAAVSIATLAGLAHFNIPSGLLEPHGQKLARAEPDPPAPSPKQEPGLKQEESVPARPDESPERTAPAQTAESPPRSPASFVGGETCAGRPCAALGTFITRAMAAQPLATAESAAPGLMVSAAPAALDTAEAGFDPLDTVTVRGLPPGVRLSVGNRISDSEWAFALGDLTDVSLILPEEGADTVSAMVEIRRREGGPLALFGLTIQHERPARPVAMSKDADADGGSARPPAQEAKAPAAPAKPAKAAKAKPPAPRAKAAQPAAQPRGLVQQGAPKAPAVAKAPAAANVPAVAKAPAAPAVLFPLPAAKSAPAEAPAEDEAIAHPGAPSRVDRPPGFETLMGLGGGFTLDEP